MPVQCQAIIWTNADLLSIGTLGINFSEIWIKIWQFFMQENEFETVFCKMVTILSQSQCVNLANHCSLITMVLHAYFNSLVAGKGNLTHYCLAMTYGVIDLGQYWFRQWLVASWHQTITWTNVDFPLTGSSSIHPRVMFTWILKISIPKLCSKFTDLKLKPHFLGNNELIRQSFILW